MALVPMPFVAAPEPRGLRYGLLTAATGPLDLPAHGAGGGVQYEPVSCGGARRYDVDCPPGAEKEFDQGDPLVEAEPFVIYATYVCGSVGHTGAELEAKVRRRLANGEQGAAEQAMADALAAGDTELAAPLATDLASVVGELQQWLYGTGNGGAGYGNVGYLHAPTRMQSYASAAGLIWADGPLLRTRMGTIWVFGDYPDDGKVYISGQVTVWRSPDVSTPPVEQLLNRASNQYRLIAEREYAVAFDCVAASAIFDTEAAS